MKTATQYLLPCNPPKLSNRIRMRDRSKRQFADLNSLFIPNVGAWLQGEFLKFFRRDFRGGFRQSCKNV